MAEIINSFDSPEQVQARKDQADPWIMYLVVRKSLGMSPGKVGAQCGHAVGMVYIAYRKLLVKHMFNSALTEEDVLHFDNFNNWENKSYRKVVLGASDSEWEKIKKELDCFVVKDAGLTEIESGSETCLALRPILKSNCPKIIKKLQVLK